MRREISLAVLLTLAAITPAATQTAAGGCGTRQAVGFLGISGIDCNCTIGSPNSDNWVFRTEPRITSLEMDTRAGQLLHIGDVITHVNGVLITTREGARAFANVRPGQAVILTVRRNGEQLRFALTAETACANDTRLLGVYAPGRPQGIAPGAAAKVHGTGVRTPAPAPVAAVQSPRGSFGFGLMCSGNCEINVERSGALRFSQPPEVYSVERGSGADKAGIRRGDLITHVNGESITGKTAGRIFGTARPGQTLRFTIRRGGSSRTVPLTAAASTTQQRLPTAELNKSSEALEQARHSLRQLQDEQAEQMRKLQTELRRSNTSEQQKLRELQQEVLRQDQQDRRALNELAAQLAHAELGMKAALADSMRSSCALAATAPRAGTSRTLRYTGVLGNTEVEVRGPQPVTVTEDGDEVTITAGATQIKVKKTKR